MTAQGSRGNRPNGAEERRAGFKQARAPGATRKPTREVATRGRPRGSESLRHLLRRTAEWCHTRATRTGDLQERLLQLVWSLGHSLRTRGLFRRRERRVAAIPWISWVVSWC